MPRWMELTRQTWDRSCKRGLYRNIEPLPDRWLVASSLSAEDGSSGSNICSMKLQGDLKRWDQWSEIRRVNPLVEISASSERRC